MTEATSLQMMGLLISQAALALGTNMDALDEIDQIVHETDKGKVLEGG